MGHSPQTARFAQLLRRLLNIKESVSPAMMEELFPTIDTLSRAPETFRLREERPFVLAAKGSGAAGLQAQVWFMNKVPGLLSVIDYLIIAFSAGGGSVHGIVTSVGLPADGFGLQNNAHYSDTRDYFAAVNGVPQTTVANDNIALPGVTGSLIVGNESGVSFPAVVVPCRYVLKANPPGSLTPGWALRLTNKVAGAGVDLFVTAIGYERQGELPEVPPIMG